MKYLRKFNESTENLFGEYKTKNVLIENLINYITEYKILSIVEMCLVSSKTNTGYPEFNFTYDSNRIYMCRLTSYVFMINQEMVYVESEDREEIFGMLSMYNKQYTNILEYLSFKLNLSSKDVKFKVEEFDVITKDGIDKISLQSLFDYYSNDDKHKSVLDTKEFNKWVGETVIKESTNDIESYLTELINILSEDNFLLTDGVLIYQRTPINGPDGGYLFKLKYKNIRLEVSKFPAYFNIITIDGMTHHLKISSELNQSLYKSIMKSYINRDFLCNYLIFNLKITLKEAVERLEEFDLIINREVNLISLNSLFDYYQIKFDLKDVISTFRSRNIPYTEPDIEFNESQESYSSTDLIVLEIIDVIENDYFLLTDEIVIKNKYPISQSNPSEGYFITFNYKEMVIEVSKYLNYFYLYGKVGGKFKNRFNDKIEQKLNDLLYKSILDASDRSLDLIWILKDRGISASIKEIKERLIEFEVIKNNSIDLISLNSLYDFYDIKFSRVADIDFFTNPILNI